MLFAVDRVVLATSTIEVCDMLYYGEALLKNGQKLDAVKMYQKSVGLNPNNVGGKKILKIFDYFALNIANFSDHANVSDSMGDYFISKGDNATAIEYLSKAIVCKDVGPGTRQKLEKLQKYNSPVLN